MMMKVLKDNRGESLVETLAAVLILTMGAIALYSMVVISARMNMDVKNLDNQIQEQMLFIEAGSGTAAGGTAAEGSVVFEFPGSAGSFSSSVKVDVYSTENSDGTQGLFSYYKKP